MICQPYLSESSQISSGLSSSSADLDRFGDGGDADLAGDDRDLAGDGNGIGGDESPSGPT